ncbi:hypothetical protein BM523_18395 [Alteromonas mediterranea]|uniref:DUF1206 domain-containing protein n=1 Tax=Alteromonas mediterranea TaxID=314275 RepID=A0AAC9AEE8_9ALTE|nr:DUF1206 domain-containing protein [Alteromonas mediterranea]AFV87493.1 hypothetical protein amad1_20100 [Alteromonas mediterranea DE1]AGP99508.1 hypothetical protein I635_20085 [Alteromonas mediterranea UM7]AGQ03666.1 hypothetical protein I636_19235 [Alteromonas mediterranea UM4b]AMJ80361.1 hypothetical protein AV942_19780 [Alteromonas mediterranea]AMJ84518.1 hypothetical protein AV941_19855 [Alteromonas mediterranea]
MKSSSKWKKATAKAGYSAKTVMYIMLGAFILTSVLNTMGREKASQSHVFITLKQQPLGQVFLGILVLGLACYASWRWLQIFITDKSTDDSFFIYMINKVFFFVSGAFYFIAAYAGGKTLLALKSSSSSQGSGKKVSEFLMQYEWGLVLVAAIGFCILIFAIVQFKHAYTTDFLEKFSLPALSQRIEKSVTVTGRLGYTARGVVYSLVGSFFILAAFLSNPSEAGGLQKALETLMQQPFGPYLIAAVGAGFIMFGLYCALEAKYRKID